uniref:Uncharacterized protein n=1 Tax=Oryza rufipogon TaxID=4529 RepID=A0A0E0PXU5_ORYRU
MAPGGGVLFAGTSVCSEEGQDEDEEVAHRRRRRRDDAGTEKRARSPSDGWCSPRASLKLQLAPPTSISSIQQVPYIH